MGIWSDLNDAFIAPALPPRVRCKAFVEHLVKSAGSFSVVTAALALPLAACGSMHGSSSDTAAPTATVTAAGAVTSGTATGTVDRSGATSTTVTTDATRSGVGTPVNAGVADGMAAAGGAPKSATAPVPLSPAPVAVATNKKSISAWVSCGTATDDTAGATKAFAAARQNAFTLVVDCPVHLHSGMAVDRGIFIDSGTSVEFTGSGKFFVDNMFHPAFVIANSSAITLTNWNVEWDGVVPISPDMGGYELDGKFVASPGDTQPAAAFNDLVLTKWLATNRAVTFDETQGWVKSIWVGGVNPAAVFFITGDSSDVVFSGLKLYVPAAAGGDHFLPMAFSFSANWKSNQTVNGKTAHASPFAIVPHGVTFSGIDLDGTLMGWQGNVRDAMFENIASHRYGDVQDSKGGTSGGIGKWFPPPHLFYLNYAYSGDPALFNTNIHINNVVDEGIRLGVARDKGVGDSISGYANSLKLGCTECSVDTYSSARPDGFMDVLPSDGLTVSNVKASFDSTFLNNAFPAAMRFPASGYSRVVLENVLLKDTADSTIKGPMGSTFEATNNGLVFSNFVLVMNRWAGADLPTATIAGATNDVTIDYAMSAQSMKVSYRQKGGVTTVLKAAPVDVPAGGSTVLTWLSHDATLCASSGAWSGTVASVGSKIVKIGASGSNTFNLLCQNALVASSTTLNVSAE